MEQRECSKSSRLARFCSAEEFSKKILSEDLKTLVDQELFTGLPYVFRRNPQDYDLLKRHLAENLTVGKDRIVVVGSARTGFSLSPDRFLTRFNEHSDIDVIIIDETLFDRIWKVILEWHYPRRYNGLRYKADRYWAGCRKRDIYWGWMTPDRLRFDGISFPTVLRPLRDMSTRWFNAFRSLSRHPELAGRKVSGRLYRSWDYAYMYHFNGLRLIKEKIQANGRN